MTDYHSHILPGIDDGSQSVEESLLLLNAGTAGISELARLLGIASKGKAEAQRC